MPLVPLPFTCRMVKDWASGQGRCNVETCRVTCWHMLTHVDACWHMLTHVDACWHMLTQFSAHGISQDASQKDVTIKVEKPDEQHEASGNFWQISRNHGINQLPRSGLVSNWIHMNSPFADHKRLCRFMPRYWHPALVFLGCLCDSVVLHLCKLANVEKSRSPVRVDILKSGLRIWRRDPEKCLSSDVQILISHDFLCLCSEMTTLSRGSLSCEPSRRGRLRLAGSVLGLSSVHFLEILMRFSSVLITVHLQWFSSNSCETVSARSFTELSDRALLRWCEKSGINRPKGYQVRNEFRQARYVNSWHVDTFDVKHVDTHVWAQFVRCETVEGSVPQAAARSSNDKPEVCSSPKCQHHSQCTYQ